MRTRLDVVVKSKQQQASCTSEMGIFCPDFQRQSRVSGYRDCASTAEHLVEVARPERPESRARFQAGIPEEKPAQREARQN